MQSLLYWVRLPPPIFHTQVATNDTYQHRQIAQFIELPAISQRFQALYFGLSSNVVWVKDTGRAPAQLLECLRQYARIRRSDAWGHCRSIIEATDVVEMFPWSLYGGQAKRGLCVKCTFICKCMRASKTCGISYKYLSTFSSVDDRNEVLLSLHSPIVGPSCNVARSSSKPEYR